MPSGTLWAADDYFDHNDALADLDFTRESDS
jgi:hypothetical protein